MEYSFPLTIFLRSMSVGWSLEQAWDWVEVAYSTTESEKLGGQKVSLSDEIIMLLQLMAA